MWREGLCSVSCLEGRSELNIHHSLSLGTLELCRMIFMLSGHWKKQVWKTAWDFNLKIIFLNWQNEVDSFPIITQLIKRKPTVNFTVERGLLCFKPSLTPAFIKLPYSLMFSSWYYFSIGVEVVVKAYIRVPVLFCSWQPFLNFENLNPTSHLKLKTEFWRAIWFS